MLVLLGCVSAGTNVDSSITYPDKQKGAHIFGPIDSTFAQYLHHQHIEWVTLVSWALQDDYNSPKVFHHYGDGSQSKRHDSTWVAQIKNAKAAGFKVFFKPHLWLNEPSEGTWRSDVFPANEEDWGTWQQSYRDFILRYASVAEQAEADMFCIGVEFTRLTLEKPEFWRQLIQDVRQVYSGKLTYAANWYQEYEGISFWEELDYIGVQAYFPLSDTMQPDLADISKGWDAHLPNLQAVHQRFQRPLLFTEMGYRSTENSAVKPWEWVDYEDTTRNIYSPQTQANCYQAFYDKVWPQPWFAGVHLWQLRSDVDQKPEAFRFDFMPQGKLAEEVMREGFQK